MGWSDFFLLRKFVPYFRYCRFIQIQRTQWFRFWLVLMMILIDLTKRKMDKMNWIFLNRSHLRVCNPNCKWNLPFWPVLRIPFKGNAIIKMKYYLMAHIIGAMADIVWLFCRQRYVLHAIFVLFLFSCSSWLLFAIFRCFVRIDVALNEPTR